MRTGLTALAKNILDADIKTELSWLFEVDLAATTASPDYYWSYKTVAYGGNTYSDTSDTLIIACSPIIMQRGDEASGIQAPGAISIQVSNPSDLNLDPDDFTGATVTIRLIMQADLGSVAESITLNDIAFDTSNSQRTEIMSWAFTVKKAWNLYGVLNLYCTDWLQDYLDGDYPTTPLISSIWPIENFYQGDIDDYNGFYMDTYCVPKVFGTPYIPIRWSKSSGTNDDFYVLGEAPNSGHSYSIQKIRPPKEYHYKSELDPNNSQFTTTITQSKAGETVTGNYATVTFDLVGSGGNTTWGQDYRHDPFCEYSLTETVSIINPVTILKTILEEIGVPAAKIDADSYEEARDKTHDWGIFFDAGFFYKQPRRETVRKICVMANMRIIVRDKIYFKTYSTVSQYTINSGVVTKGADVGEGNFSYEPILSQDLKDSGSVAWRDPDKPQTDPLKCIVSVEGGTANNVSGDIVDATFISSSSVAQRVAQAALERTLLPDANITAILKAKALQIECGDVVTIEGRNYNAISNYNIMINTIEISKDCLVAVKGVSFRSSLTAWESMAPTTFTTITDDSTPVLYPAIAGSQISGASDGESPNDISDTIRYIGGADQEMVGDDSNPSKIIWKGDDTDIEMAIANDWALYISSVTPTVGAVYFGSLPPWYTDVKYLGEFGVLTRYNNALKPGTIQLKSSVGNTDDDYTSLYIKSSPNVRMQLHINDGGSEEIFYFGKASIYTDGHKTVDLGGASNAFDDVYAEDYPTVADFYHLDSFDDLAVIDGIKPSGEVDPISGLPLIDDDTLPQWILFRNKDKRIARDPDGKPYLNLKTVCSLLMGAVRALHRLIKKLDERVEWLEKNYTTRD